MSRTTRTIASVGLAAVASLGVITAAAPAQAADAWVMETVNASWTVVGTFEGVPGNVHVGDINVSDLPALDGSPFTSVWVGLTDYQCPDGVTSPDAGDCTWLRISGSNGEDTGAAVELGAKLATASVNTTIPGGWGTPDGGSVDEDFTIDVDLVGTGSLIREVKREQGGDGVWHVVSKQSRSATMTGTVVGVPLHGVTAEIVRKSYL